MYLQSDSHLIFISHKFDNKSTADYFDIYNFEPSIGKFKKVNNEVAKLLNCKISNSQDGNLFETVIIKGLGGAKCEGVVKELIESIKWEDGRDEINFNHMQVDDFARFNFKNHKESFAILENILINSSPVVNKETLDELVGKLDSAYKIITDGYGVNESNLYSMNYDCMYFEEGILNGKYTMDDFVSYYLKNTNMQIEEKWFDDEEFCASLLSKNDGRNVFYKISDRIKDDVDFFINLSEKVYFHFPIDILGDKLLDNENIVSNILSKNGYQLAYVSDRLKDKFEVVKIAVQEDGRVLRYASDRLKNNLELIACALKNDVKLEYMINHGIGVQLHEEFKQYKESGILDEHLLTHHLEKIKKNAEIISEATQVKKETKSKSLKI